MQYWLMETAWTITQLYYSMLCKIARHANTIKVNILKWNIAGETSTWISIFENVSIMQPVLQNYGDTTQAVTISGVPGPLQKQLTLELQGCQYYLYILTLSRLYCTVEKLNICCCHLLFVLSRSSMYWQQKAFLIPNIFMNKGLFQGGKKNMCLLADFCFLFLLLFFDDSCAGDDHTLVFFLHVHYLSN